MEEHLITDLVERGELDYSFKGNGVATGNVGTLTLENKTENDLKVRIPKGTIFASPLPGVQDMGTASGMAVAVPGRSSRTTEIEDGFCADDYAKPPPSDQTPASTPRQGGLTTSAPHAELIDTIERNLSQGRYNAVRLMREKKARQTLIQWAVWILANPATFDKTRAQGIITGQFKKKGRTPDPAQVTTGVDMLFDDIELTIKETPNAAMATPVAAPATQEESKCECHGSVTKTQSSTGPQIRISEEYKDEDERAELVAQMTSELESNAIKVPPSTLAVYANDAAVSGYGDARAAYKFLDRPGSIISGEWIGRTERLSARVFGSNSANIWVEKHACRECTYRSVVGAAAIAIVGGDAVILDPLEGTESGFRFLENTYDVACEFIEQDWLTAIFDFIKDHTTHYFVNTQCETSIEAHVGTETGSCTIDVHAQLDRDGSTATVKNLRDTKTDWTLVSSCIPAEHLQVRIDGTTSMTIQAEDGGLGIIGQDSMIGYVWYWACEATDREGNVVVTGDTGYDWRYTITGDKVTPSDLAAPQNVTDAVMGDILTSTIGSVFESDPLNCEKAQDALETAIVRWVGELATKANAYKSVARELENR